MQNDNMIETFDSNEQIFLTLSFRPTSPFSLLGKEGMGEVKDSLRVAEPTCLPAGRRAMPAEMTAQDKFTRKHTHGMKE